LLFRRSGKKADAFTAVQRWHGGFEGLRLMGWQ
jgi:hypothetical protein